jgi:hypothetical protein
LVHQRLDQERPAIEQPRALFDSRVIGDGLPGDGKKLPTDARGFLVRELPEVGDELRMDLLPSRTVRQRR